MCMIFTLFFCGMFATAAYGYKFGDPKLLVTPFDTDGNLCGSGNTSAYTYLYWPDLTSSLLSFNTTSLSINSAILGKTVCVKACPGFAETP